MEKTKKKTVVQQHEQNFKTLEEAFANGATALVYCKLKSTGEHVAVISAVNRSVGKDGNEIIDLVPFAMFFNGNPYDLLEPPIKENGDVKSDEEFD